MTNVNLKYNYKASYPIVITAKNVYNKCVLYLNVEFCDIKREKYMKKAFIIFIAVIAALVLGYGIKYAVSPVPSQVIERATIEHSAMAKGYIVREEWAYYAERAGKLYKNVSVGDRVMKDALIYTIYDDSVDNNTIKELNTLNKKISLAREQTDQSTYGSAAISVESAIAARTSQIIAAAKKNDVSGISQYKQDIISLRNTGSFEDANARLAELEGQKQSLDAGILNSRSERYAEISGVFTMYYDGFEGVLDRNDVAEYTVGQLENLKKPVPKESVLDKVKEGDFICALVNNHKWSLILITDETEMSAYAPGDGVTVRFKNIADAEQTGTISYISSEEQNKDGKCFVLIDCQDYFEGAFSYREVDAEIIFERYSGYKVPISAVRTTEKGGHKVIGILDNRQIDCSVDVLYTDTKEEFAIVESQDGTSNKLSSMDRIVIGER